MARQIGYGRKERNVGIRLGDVFITVNNIVKKLEDDYDDRRDYRADNSSQDCISGVVRRDASAADNSIVNHTHAAAVNDVADLLDSQLRAAARGTPWNETYDAIYATLDTYLEEVNANPVANTVQ